MALNTGIAEEDRKAIADDLCRVLADTYTLYLKTHNFHWNVTGPNFSSLHKLFEEQYSELAEAVDEIAERIRTLGHPAPGSYKAFAEHTSLKDEDGVPDWKEMVEQLVNDNEATARTLRSAFSSGEAGNDEATIDLLTERLRVHEKAAWMLRSHLDR